MKKQIEATKEHCRFCFQTLEAKLKKQKLPMFPRHMEDYEVPLFVTWMSSGQLRGCVGTFNSQKLSNILGQYTLISALEDDRFDPIQLDQLPNLSVGVSFLVNFTPNLGAFDWQIGRHGIILELKRNGRLYTGTFLPQVAEEEKWDKKTTLKHLMHKAGCKLPLQMVEKDLKITTYESSKINLSYEEWQREKRQASNSA